MLTEMPSHHPEEARLVDYTTGALHEPGSLVIATHLALCPSCRQAVAELEAVGGAVLDAMPLTSVSDGALDDILARLDEPEPAPCAPPLPPVPAGDTGIPRPLRDYLGAGYQQLDWTRRLGGVEEFPITTTVAGLNTRLIKLGAGRKLPVHTHRGYEMTLVLTGAFSDHTGRFECGDFVELDGSTEHQPVIWEESECICLAVTDQPLRFTGPLGRLLNPFLKQ